MGKTDYNDLDAVPESTASATAAAARNAAHLARGLKASQYPRIRSDLESDHPAHRLGQGRTTSLHQTGNPVVLLTVWDAWSAKLGVGAGFSALTIRGPQPDSAGWRLRRLGAQLAGGMEHTALGYRGRREAPNIASHPTPGLRDGR